MTEDNLPSTIKDEVDDEQDEELYSMVSQPQRAPEPGSAGWWCSDWSGLAPAVAATGVGRAWRKA